ncbi:putative peptidase precursor [Clavibacter michiganensis]|uniref:Putative peptidase n=1 Tax=Clavibacter michiganensis TaxID=28447 RepID=A0A251Y4H3_9MICO|nr:S1 family peptidase [Clavibacter michiganensis]OUE18918.1 putative peptidase precursor [Clavibacter michiganensis]
MLANMLVAGLAITLGLSGGAPTPTTADPDPAQSQIVAGRVAPHTPWVVQIVETGGTIGAGLEEDCTGVQVDASWVLTARHCTGDTVDIDVYQSNSVTHSGHASPVDRVVVAPKGDIALMHLAAPAPLSAYAPLDLRSGAASSGTGTIEGYGFRAHGRQATRLYAATVRLTGAEVDGAGGAAQEVTGISGAAAEGDSGGPLLVHGRVRGLCSQGLGDAEDDPHGVSVYALLSQDAAWIRSTTGVRGAGR